MSLEDDLTELLAKLTDAAHDGIAHQGTIASTVAEVMKLVEQQRAMAWYPYTTNYTTGSGGGGGWYAQQWPVTEPEEKLTPEDKAGLREQFAAGKACVYCGALHLRACPRLKRIRWAKPGEPEEVEYWPSGWPTDGLVWPEDVQEEPEE